MLRFVAHSLVILGMACIGVDQLVHAANFTSGCAAFATSIGSAMKFLTDGRPRT